ncbi:MULTISPECIES: hypothetical protein [Cohnella]|uniref:hypothetical protein n=1 Tax=Cohnella TaxID=329857 RepID=UPI0009BA3203|nr:MULTISPECIES: hypothetical protein [Cohnella]MBN2984333.1 hypothetical protein [Cohnella algarum]
MPVWFAAGIGWLIASVLWWSGWRNELAEGVPGRWAGLYLAGWPFACAAAWMVPDGFSLNGSFGWTVMFALALFGLMDADQRWMSLAAAMFIAAAVLFLFSLASMSKGEKFDAFSLAAVAAGIVAATMLGTAVEQLAAVFLGCLAASLAMSGLFGQTWFQHSDAAGSVGIHPWWLSVFAARSLSLVLRFLSNRFGGRENPDGWDEGGEKV